MIIPAKITDYNVPSDDNFILEPGCLDWLQDVKSVPLVFEHRLHLEIGKVSQFDSRTDGVYGLVEVFDTPGGKYVQKLINADALDSLSIGYFYDPKKYSKIDEKGFSKVYCRVGEVMVVDEISIVTKPAYPGAVFDGKANKKTETVEQTVERLRKFIGIPWEWKAEEINQIMMEKFKQHREHYWQQIYP